MWGTRRNRERRDEDDGEDEYGSGAPPVLSDPLLAMVNSGEITNATPLSPGQHLHCEQDGKWWDAEVVHVMNDGRVKVHYTGWERSWDEAVTRNRLRFADQMPKPIHVVLEGGPEITGTLAGSYEDFLVLTDSRGDKVFVNKQKIVHFTVRR
jgi:hypothetical protein